MEVSIIGTVHTDIIQGEYIQRTIANKDKVGEGYIYHEGVEYIFARKVRTKEKADKEIARLIHFFATFPDGSEPCHLIVKEGSWFKIFSSNTCLNALLIERRMKKQAS